MITLGVPDLAEARAFYVDGLGWSPVLDVPGQVVFLQVGHGVALSLFGAQDLVDDVRGDGGADGTGDDAAAAGWAPPAGPRGVTLAHNVGSPEEVDAAIADATAAGGRLVKPAQRAEWGGYHGYVADPAGTLWEIAHNPTWSVAEDGTVTI